MPENPCGHDPERGITSFVAACLTVSDRCAAGEREDRSGSLLVSLAESMGGNVAHTAVVPDELEAIQETIRAWLAEDQPPRLILTTGGTGPAPRDVTPEATEPLLEKRLPGVEEALRRSGLPRVPTALLGRGLVGTAAQTLIVNLPGSPGAIADAGAVLPGLVGHILGLLDQGGRGD
jgi:molybdenum cofactor synthesis domain-containing protein